MATRRTEAERIAALEADLAAAKAKAEERTAKAAAEAAEKSKAKAARLTKQAEKLVTTISDAEAKLAEINLELVSLDVDFTEVEVEEFTELTLDEV